MSALAAQTVDVALGGRAVLHDVSVTLNGSGLTAIIGPNGAGKSTLLRALCGLLVPESGTVTLDGENIQHVQRAARAQKIGYLPQHHTAVWAMPVIDVVGLGRMPWSGARDSLHDAAIHAALDAMDVLHLAHRPMTALSGGERSRVMLARLLAGQHAILLCDEPLAHTDPRHQILVMETLRARAEAVGNQAAQTVAVVMHDLALAARYARRVIVMDGGHIVGDGAPADILTAQTLATVFGIGSIVEQRAGGLLVTPWS